jgi:hypothetical protein
MKINYKLILNLDKIFIYIIAINYLYYYLELF